MAIAANRQTAAAAAQQQQLAISEATLAADDNAALPRTAHQMYLHEHLARMHHDIESTTRKLELEKRRLYKLEKDLERTREEHEEKVLKVKKDTLPRKTGDASDSGGIVPPLTVKKLEHRLGKAVSSLNTFNHENKDIRDKIDSIRRERLQMNQVFKNLQIAIKDNQRELTQLQTETDSAKREQDDLQHQINAKRKQLDIERKEFKNNVQDLQERMKKQDRKELTQRVVAMQSTVEKGSEEDKNKIKAIKSHQEETPKIGMTVVVTSDLEKYEKECRASGVSRRKRPPLGQKGKIDKVDFSDSTICLANGIWVPIRALEDFEELRPQENFNSPLVMRRILKLAFLNAIQRRHLKQQMKNSEVFEQAFATIKSTTGISDIDEIVKIFIGLEQRNFSLLTYVNVLNGQIETFEKHNRELEEHLQAQKRTDEDSEQKRTHALKDLIQQIESTKKVTEENKLQAREQDDILERCKPLIRDILDKVEKENTKGFGGQGFGGQAAPEFTGENVLAWLTYIEKTLTQWKDFLPDTQHARHLKNNNKNYKYTVGNQVLQLQPKNFDKKGGHQATPLVKQGELPSAANVFPDTSGATRPAPNKEDDSSDEEDDLTNHPWEWKELKDKAVASVAKRRRHRKTEAPGGGPGGGGGAAGGSGPGGSELQPRAEAAAEANQAVGGVGGGLSGALGAPTAGESAPGELAYEDMVEKNKDNDDESLGSDETDVEDDIGPTDEEINEIFLKRYKMSKEDLQGMADKMGIQLNNLCYLKQEFDAYDEDRSGYIDVKELKGLLEKLGEELSDEELDQAFRELDSDGSGEIEFFEFVEWFTSED
jgi:hypothetical protein